MTAKHTPTPWIVGFSDGTGRGDDENGAWIITRDHVVTIVAGGADDWGCKQGVRTSEDAAFIVRACNTYEGIIGALKESNELLIEYLDGIGGCDHPVGICCCCLKSVIESNKALIAKAEGK